MVIFLSFFLAYHCLELYLLMVPAAQLFIVVYADLTTGLLNSRLLDFFKIVNIFAGVRRYLSV